MGVRLLLSPSERGMGVKLLPLFLSPTYIEESFYAPPDHDDGQEKQDSDDNV